MAKNGGSKTTDGASDQGLALARTSLTPARAKSLKTIKGCRLELIRLYDATKTGVLDPTVAGRCAYILNSLIGSARDHQFEERLAELEASLKHNQPNGHDRRGLRQ
jgi:hypothetical protein